MLDTAGANVYAYSQHIHPNIYARISAVEPEKTPPEYLWDLSLLTDSAYCSTRTETDLFVKTTGIDPVAFSRYCVFDATYGVWRLLVEGRITPMREP